MRKILKFCSRYLPKNDTFCHLFLDSTLFHQFLAVSVPNIVNIGHFTLIKVRRNSGELKNMPFLVGQNYHLRIAKTQGSSGWNYSAPPMTHREAQNAPKTFNKDKTHQHKAFWSTLEPFIRPWESQNDHFHRPGTWLSTQLDFHLKKFAHFGMWLDEEAKMGLSLSVYCKFFVLRGSSWWLCAKNLQNFQSYRLNYRLFGKLTTI